MITYFFNQPIASVPKQGALLENWHLLLQLALVAKGQPKTGDREGGLTSMQIFHPWFMAGISPTAPCQAYA